MSGVVFQANLHHSKAATDCLVLDMLKSKSQVVALVQEPYLGARGKPLGIPRQLSTYHHTLGGRAAIFSKNCNLLLCPAYSGRDVVTCQLHLGNGREVFVVSAYADIKIGHAPQELVQLLEDKRGSDALIVMDANAHSRMWGSSASNPRGDMIEEFIFHHDLCLCNKGTQPTFVARGTSTIIDITLCSRGLVDNIKGWKVDTRDQMSDHRRIIFRLDLEAYAPSWC